MKKRIMSLVLVIAMLVCIVPSAAAVTNLDSTQFDYQVYDLETGESSYHSFAELPSSSNDDNYGYSPGYYPNGVADIDSMFGSTVSPQAIVGNDDRVKVTDTTQTPYCNTVQVYSVYPNGYVGIGSGFVIGPSAVATAAHCVYNKDCGGLATSVEIIPAKNGSVHPYGSTTVGTKQLVVSLKYQELTSYNGDHDWAVVEMSEPLGNKTGWLGLYWQSGSYYDTLVYNTGYPEAGSTSGQSVDRYMFVGTGLVKSCDTYTFDGNWDATGGNSGGPVFMYDAQRGFTAIGILTSGVGTNGSSYPNAYSTATRITKAVYDLFMSYR